MVVDIAVVALTLVFGLGNDLVSHNPQRPRAPWAWAFDLALALPLLLRRRHPALVFFAVSAIALVEWLTDVQAAGAVAILVALYALGLYERRWAVVAVALVIAATGVVMVMTRWAPPTHRIGSAVLMTGTVTAALVLGVYVRTRRSYVLSVLERAATAERERDQQAVIASAAERARISREMHDIVAHSLSVMIALSDGAAMSVERTPAAARDAMEKSSLAGRQALEEMRRLLGVLRDPEVLELAPQPGLVQVDELIASVRAAGLEVDLVVTGHPATLLPGAQLAAYRLIQESLTNVLKHAPGAQRATVRISYGEGTVDIDVENDDAPGSAPASESTRGQGLTGMRERAALFGGTLAAGRRPDGGWSVRSRLHVDDIRHGT